MENRIYYIVMEYCEGGDLLDMLKGTPLTRFPCNLALNYFKQIVNGVHFLHSQNITHRDLSLENILLKNNTDPYNTDINLVTPKSCVVI